MILLSAQHIQKSFGGNTVLRDASLVLQDGQRLGLVGVNGQRQEHADEDHRGPGTLRRGHPVHAKGLRLATWPSRAW